MTKLIPAAVIGLATAGMLAGAVPATAAASFVPAQASVASDMSAHQYRNRGWHDQRGYRQNHYNNGGYNGRVWRGRDGRYYCRRDNGTTGLLIGGAVGGLVGNGVAGRGDRTLGTILGVAGGALLGREIDRSGSRCR